MGEKMGEKKGEKMGEKMGEKIGEKMGEKIGEKSPPVVHGENQQVVKTFRLAKMLITRAGHVSKFWVVTILPRVTHFATRSWNTKDEVLSSPAN